MSKKFNYASILIYGIYIYINQVSIQLESPNSRGCTLCLTAMDIGWSACQRWWIDGAMDRWMRNYQQDTERCSRCNRHWYLYKVLWECLICIFHMHLWYDDMIYMIYMICTLGYMGLWKDSHHRHMCQFFEMFISRLAPWLHENSSQPNHLVPWFWRNHWPVWPVFCSILVDWEGFCQLWWSCSRPRKMFQWCSIKVSFVNFFCWLPEVFHSRRLTGRLVMKFSLY